jgi:Tol biopolymer transport system component
MSKCLRLSAALLVVPLAAALAADPTAGPTADSPPDQLGPYPGERHLANIRQLTFGGENAEAYFSFDGKWLVFQSTRDSIRCDQIFTMKPDGSDLRLASTGRGRTTCAYFMPDGNRIIYASTHLASADCPPAPDFSRGYVWPIYPGYDLFGSAPDGSDLRRLTDTSGYDAEATVGPDGTIVFTSARDGDIDLYTMSPEGKDVRRLTTEIGYDGGAFFSADGKQIIYRAHHPAEAEQIADFKALLADGLIRPATLEICIMNADGSDKKQLTHNGKANFCPFMSPSGKKIIFSSNLDDPKSREFDLYMMNADGSGLERVTTAPSFDGFPMWSPDGKRLVWGSNRMSQATHETNIFIADWVE